jgi:hypothetical protein
VLRQEDPAAEDQRDRARQRDADQTPVEKPQARPTQRHRARGEDHHEPAEEAVLSLPHQDEEARVLREPERVARDDDREHRRQERNVLVRPDQQELAPHHEQERRRRQDHEQRVLLAEQRQLLQPRVVVARVQIARRGLIAAQNASTTVVSVSTDAVTIA